VLFFNMQVLRVLEPNNKMNLNLDWSKKKGKKGDQVKGKENFVGAATLVWTKHHSVRGLIVKRGRIKRRSSRY